MDSVQNEIGIHIEKYYLQHFIVQIYLYTAFNLIFTTMHHTEKGSK